MFRVQNGQDVAEAYNSSARCVLFHLFPCPLALVAPLEWLLDMLSKSPQSSVLYNNPLEYYSTALGMFFHFDLRQPAQLLGVFFYKEQSISILDFFSSTQKTIIHPILELLLIRHLGLVQPAFHGIGRELCCFFFSQLLTVFLDTPNVLARPRMLLRSWYDLMISSRRSSV